MLKWKIKFEGKSCIFPTLKSAKECIKNDFFSSGVKDTLLEIFRKKGLRMYPIIMSNKQLTSLKEFDGW